MHTRGRRLRFTAVLALTVLTLTGFSTGRHHSHSRHGSSGGGGGCSSSSQDHDTSTSSGGSTSGSTHRSRPTYRSTPTATSSATARPLKDGTAVLKRCASVEDPYSTVEVRNPNGREALFTVKVTYKAGNGSTLADTTSQVSVPANGRATLRMAAAGTGALDRLDHCEVDPRATADR
ncbi:hypothetical protein OG601_20385 [Streptomyces sp. NBC_01239]|uniref:hypothetical protein n=1 Tax=Streptomyces sp. NBC_01239 TaxID=2903792 RepID=UPI00225240EB|nr:hypothetical protein [Streptomyces sp. NBC_01239]MCX4812956.1 hypothetical protein [Streptomyces sp. NBC_01239]